MSEIDRPVRVTGEERRHPGIRLLARACIVLAQQRLEKEAASDVPSQERRRQLKSGKATEAAVHE